MFKSELIKTDVTAVKLTNKRILAGIGSFLFIFDQTGQYITKIQIFDGHKIHGIQVEEKRLLLYGGCHVHTSECDFSTAETTKLCHKQINDWILTAQWLKNNFIALVVMKNKLIICDTNLSVVRQIVCKESCILYSAFIVYNQINDLVVLSGTVFGQILVWKANLEETRDSSPVLAKLKGHNGVIFSVHYNKNGYICSTSDDRSSILWSVENKCLHTELQRSTPNITLLRKFYGHSSRIFRCLVLENTLLTAGEDSHINVWNFDGELLNKIATNQGGPVWAIDCDNNLIVSGGGGCGVLMSHMKCDPVCQRLTMPDGETPKRIGLLQKSIVVVTEKGALYCYIRDGETWLKVGEHEELKSYSILEVSSCRNLVSLSGYHGEIYIYQEQKNSLKLRAFFKINNQPRIYSFRWLSCSTFLTYEDKGVLTLWYLTTTKVTPVTNFQLPAKEMTSACQAPKTKFIIGDRKGNIYLYELKTNSPIQVIKKAHNHQGITQLQNQGNRIVSMGRDGTIKTFLLGDKLELLSTDKVPFTWLTKSLDDLLLAFSGNVFVVWDYKTRKTLVEHLCGGGHRSWDFQKQDMLTFAYVKERVLYVVSWEEKQICPITVVAGYHLNTINSISVVLVENRYVVVSGSEDTNLRISVFAKDYFRCLQNVKSHLSNIKAVCLHRMTTDKYLVFSGGGRGQMICWQLFLGEDVEDSECRQECSYYEKSQENMLESEIRIMDLKTVELQKSLFLLAACSDGNVNIFRVDKTTNKHELKFVNKLFHQTRCVTKILVLPEMSVLVTMSSNGIFCFWNLSHFDQDSPFKTMKVHQSGVVDCRFHYISDSLALLLSGGDDGCFVLNLFRIETDGKTVNLTCIDQFRDATSHCAQISGAWISDNFFLTTGIDQKLLVFRWCVEEGRLSCTFVGRYNSAVADIQGMECNEDDECFHVFLYGKGVEYVKVVKETLL